jgi:transcriptional regulator with XRE-family HTH domain
MMINAHLTGAYISRLRRAKDWTQLELAEKLHVTHQAVSRWETGDSFPDVSVLPQLARLFGVSVDDLLNGEPAHRRGGLTPGDLVEELSRGEPQAVARRVKDDPEGVEAMLKAAPLARPSQMDDVVAHLAGYAFTLEQVAGLAPFVSRKVLDSILAGVDFEQIDANLLIDLAPFTGRETLDRLARQIPDGDLGIEELVELAPFLGQEPLQELLFHLVEDRPMAIEHLVELAHFIARGSLDELVRRLPLGPLAVGQAIELAPFVSREALDQITARLEDPALVGEYLDEFAPFLSKAGLRQAVSQVKGRLSAEELLRLAPFLDQETLEEFLHKGDQE